ncbi:Glu-tRNA(Gln) amidotransferase subunit GatD [Candidatus Woesearchaeota archaeon]|nr:Glu-tRNA(Gln) amidotransferase subunit GatD [Candidatus Woesearchaeota archaeon]
MSAKPGDTVEVVTPEKRVKGILMPKPELFGEDTVILKLENGYNVGIDKKKIKEIKLLEPAKEQKAKKEKAKPNKKLPTISILHTGGTIASKVDYRTGAVVSKFTPEDMLEMFPELNRTANIQSRLVFQMFSEDMRPGHWQALAKEVEKEIKAGVEGIIITHGTDTMHYTSAALSFILQNLPVPVLLVGAQRSSDRGSSDAAINLIAAARFIIETDFSGVAICMHGTSEDKCCYIHQGTKVRKLHASRRDAFRSVNVFPYAKVFDNGKIEFLRKDYAKKDKKRRLETKNKFEENVSLIKIHPFINLNYLEKCTNCKGIVLEGTGLGHFPCNALDDITKINKENIEVVRKLTKKIPIVMTSQTLYGQVNMNVYSTGRDIMAAGVISGEDMLPETAFVKLAWVLGQTKNLEEAKKLMHQNIVGEIAERIDEKAFLY